VETGENSLSRSLLARRQLKVFDADLAGHKVMKERFEEGVEGAFMLLFRLYFLIYSLELTRGQ
jgi:hypothetical protein